MAKQVELLRLISLLAFLFVLGMTCITMVEAKTCKPSGRIKGRHVSKSQCDPSSGDDCCQPNKHYITYKCSPPVSNRTKAMMTINDFQKGGDGGGPAECDNKYHSNKKPVVALSTGWFSKMKRCHKHITIHANGRSVKAMVVDECDSTKGCDSDHGFQPPCQNNIVDSSEAVWEALHVPKNDWGWMQVHWSDA